VSDSGDASRQANARHPPLHSVYTPSPYDPQHSSMHESCHFAPFSNMTYQHGVALGALVGERKDGVAVEKYLCIHGGGEGSE